MMKCISVLILVLLVILETSAKSPGDDDYCTDSSRCGVGQGDCDSDSECRSGLKCGLNNCKGHDYDTKDDCCVAEKPGDDDYCTHWRRCGVGEGDCDSDDECKPGLECGNSNCVGRDYHDSDDCCQKKTSGHDDYCTSWHRCGEGEGDCDSKDECKNGLECGNSNCVGVGYSDSDDCCFRDFSRRRSFWGKKKR